VPAEAGEKLKRKYRVRALRLDLTSVAQRVTEVKGIGNDQVWAAGRHRKTVEARSLLCYWAVRELGISMAEMAGKRKLSVPSVSKSVARGSSLVKVNGYSLIETKKRVFGS
jgi:putative transposase